MTKKNSSKEILMRLKDIRRKKGLSLQDIAGKAGVDYQRVGRIERGETKTTVEMLERLAKVLNVPLSEIIGNDDIKEIKGGNVTIEDAAKESVYIIPMIYQRLDQLLIDNNITASNQEKVEMATSIYKAIQDIYLTSKDLEGMVQVFFEAFDEIFERVLLSGHENDQKE
jgi:transcriptional regulator with XRE-family HTH domain